MNHISSKTYALLAALPLVYLAIFYFCPLIKILTVSLIPDETWELGSLKKLVTSGIYLSTLWFTTWQAAVSTILTLLLALPGAYVFARYQFWGKELLRSFTTVPFVLPTVVVAAAFHSLLGPHGLVNEFLMRWFHLTSPPVAVDQTIALIAGATEAIYINKDLILHVLGHLAGITTLAHCYLEQAEKFGCMVISTAPVIHQIADLEYQALDSAAAHRDEALSLRKVVVDDFLELQFGDLKTAFIHFKETYAGPVAYSCHSMEDVRKSEGIGFNHYIHD